LLWQQRALQEREEAAMVDPVTAMTDKMRIIFSATEKKYLMKCYIFYRNKFYYKYAVKTMLVGLMID
jgi:hypothetical protein